MAKYAARVIETNLEDELGVSFGRYARTTILARALPDVRDGLKPVQRRIIYAMHLAGSTPEKRYRKCAKTVGEVMGNFHPHGDQSIYDALVRLAQDWKMRHLLVDGHGNFGSIDDDPPAAMRYTESRLAPIAIELTRDIQKDTVNFVPNFDDNEMEPSVLPSRYPNLLVNGSSGVSTGFSTEIPPHNLGEVIDALVAMIDNPDIDLDGLMSFVKGPDFPTGGIIAGTSGLREAYENGKGRVALRGRTTVESRRDGRMTIVVTEIPYGVIKANLVRAIERLRIDKVVPGLSDIRDETDRDGLRIAIDLGRGVDPEPVLGYLYKKTDLQVYRHFQMVAIAKQRPCQLGLREILDAYLEHQKEVVSRRCRYDLNKAETRLHLVEGLIRAVDVLDEVIATIRQANDRPEAHAELMKKFEFTDAQTHEILELKLHRLTGLQILQLTKEQSALKKQSAKLKKILKSDSVLLETIRTEMLGVKEMYAEPRRSSIQHEVDEPTTKIEVTVTVKEQPSVLGISADGYVKRSVPASFEKTGGDAASSGVKDGDVLKWLYHTNTLHRVLLFTARGQCFAPAVHQLPEAKWGEIGTALVNVVGIEKDDKLVQVIPVNSFDPNLLVAFVTRKGVVKRTSITEFDSQRNSGVLAIKIAHDDELIRVMLCIDEPDNSNAGATDEVQSAGDGVEATVTDEGSAQGQFMVITREGMCIRFNASSVSRQGRSAGGVRAIKLYPKDRVVDAIWLADPSESELATITEEGRAKRTLIEEYPLQNRGGRGVRSIRKLVRLPHKIVAISQLQCTELEFLRIRLVVSDGSDQILPVTVIQHAARDGNGYDFGTLSHKQRVRDAQLIVLPKPQEPTDDDAETSEGEPSPSNGDANHDMDTEPTVESPVDSAAKGSWARPVEDDRIEGAYFLPGMDQETKPEDEN